LWITTTIKFVNMPEDLREERRKSDVQIGRLDERIKSLEDKVKDGTSAILSEIKELKDNIAGQLSDHETRLRFIERYLWSALGIIAVIEFVGFAYILIIFKK
jgi:chromosome segregation ATPase